MTAVGTKKYRAPDEGCCSPRVVSEKSTFIRREETTSTRFSGHKPTRPKPEIKAAVETDVQPTKGPQDRRSSQFRSRNVQGAKEKALWAASLGRRNNWKKRRTSALKSGHEINFGGSGEQVMALIKSQAHLPRPAAVVVKVVNPRSAQGTAACAPRRAAEPRTRAANNTGHVTTRHQGGGHKAALPRQSISSRAKDGIIAKVERLEHDPNRSANIALLCYADGERPLHHRAQGSCRGRAACRAARTRRSRTAIRCRSENIPVGTHRALRRDDARARGAPASRGAGRHFRAVAGPRRKAITRSCGCGSGEIRKVHVNLPRHHR